MNRLVAAVPLLACCLLPTLAQAQFKGMRARIPADANTLVLINAEKMFGSRVASREHWESRRKAAYENGISALPPDATEVAIAGRSDHEFGESIWELALVRLSKERNVTTVAQRFGGTMDTIEGRSAARLPNDLFVLQMSPEMLGSYTPANRQDVSRWLRSTNINSGDQLSPYLEQAFTYATKVGSPIIMAMDVEGVVSPTRIKQRIEENPVLKAAGLPTEQLVKLLSGARGVTLGVTMGDESVGAIRVDFKESPEILASIGKELMINVLQHQGAMIEDFRNWTPSIEGNTFLLRGTFSTNGIRRVMSVLELPPALHDSMFDAASPGSDPEGNAILLATEQYWNSVTSLVDDLREKPKRDHVKTFGQAAMWYDKYARKIDRLPILNVDQEMLDYGVYVASAFRDAEAAMKGVGMRSSLRTASNNPSSGGYYATMGGYRANSGYGPSYGPQGVTMGVGAGRASINEKGRTDAIIRGQERTAGAASVQQIWQGIDETTAAVRRSMVQKYKTDF
ncbi:hypothetical protein N9D23_11250 [Rubripirellula sp.]|jgi:hypothetical protein|nr:hypothetical protein [Rubripirellula sp.]MDF1842882.1 hypothetical protein [Rubripirellula sp.]